MGAHHNGRGAPPLARIFSHRTHLSEDHAETAGEVKHNRLASSALSETANENNG